MLRPSRVFVSFLAFLMLPVGPLGTASDVVLDAEWVSSPSPASAMVWGMGGSSDVLVASTIGTGAFRSLDNGRHWEPIETGVDEARIVFDPIDPQRGYIAGYGGLARTTDAGATWEVVVMRSPAQRVAVSPSGTVATATMADGYVWIHVSHDGGTTWTVHDAPSNRWISAYGIAFGSTDSDLVYTSISTTWTSHDGGATWTQTGSGGTALARADGGVLWTNGGGSLQRSSDDGDTWQAVTVPDGTPSVLAPRPGGGVYGAGYLGIVFTDDDGATWTNMGFGDVAFAATALLADPEDPAAVLMGDENLGVSHIAPDGAGGYRIESRTTGFRPIMITAIGSSHDGSVLLAGGPLALFQSVDGGNTWYANGAGVGFPTLAATAGNVDGSVLYAGGTNFIFGPYLQVSRDGGLTWDTQLPDHDDGVVRRIVTHPVEPDRAWVAVDAELAPGLLIETRDAGLTWTTLFTIEGLHDVAYKASSDTLFVATDLGLFTQLAGAWVPVQVATEGSFAVATAGDAVFSEGQPQSVWSNVPGLPVMAPWADTGKYVDDLEAAPDASAVYALGPQTLHRCEGSGPGACIEDSPGMPVLAIHSDGARIWTGTAGSGLLYKDL